MYPKLSRLVTYDEGTSPTKLRDASITWSRDKSKTFYVHIQSPWSPKLDRKLNQDEGSPPKKSPDTSTISLQTQDYRDVKGKLVLVKNKHENAN